MDREIMEATEPKMQRAYQHLLDEFKTIRTGRASTSLVEDIVIEHYGQNMTIKQVASISTPDGKSITISPWDQTATAAIEKAIREDRNTDLNPLSDGRVIHINVPPLNQERREQMVKQIGEKVEQCNIALRNIRHDQLNEAKRLAKDKTISEDESRGVEKKLNYMIENFRRQIEAAASAKQQEIREI